VPAYSKPGLSFPPFQQGGLDSLCGLYSIINAERFINRSSDEETQQLFNDLIHYLSRRGLLTKFLIDGIIHSLAAIGKGLAVIVSVVGDRFIIDNSVDTLAAETWNVGLALRTVQTGRLRQYVMFIVVGTVVLFLIASVWRYAVAG